VKHLGYSKDIENDRIRDTEKRKDAEIRLLEKMIESLKKEKKDIEERLDEVIMRSEILNSKNAEEHHNTVKYFENMVA
jgi:hypothetical protein